MRFVIIAIAMISTTILTATTLGQVKRPIEVDDLFAFKRLADPQISPDGSRVVFVVTTVNFEENSTSASLWVADVSNPAHPRQLTNTLKKDLHPRWSPDGQRILFQSTRSGAMQLWCIDVDGGEARQLTTIATDAATGIWARDGKQIAFVSAVFPEFSGKPFSESDRLNKDKLELVEKNPVKVRVFDKLFFRHWDSYVEDKRQHLFVMDYDPKSGAAGIPRDVTLGDRDSYPTSTTFSIEDDFCFSPDGTHLVFTAVPASDQAWSTNHDLCRVPVTGGATNWETLMINPAADGSPAFSPEGNRLAFRAQAKPGNEADKWNVFIASCDSSGKLSGTPVNLTEKLDRSADQVRWAIAADGKSFVIFAAEERGKVQIFSVASDGRSVPTTTESEGSIGGLSCAQENGQFAYLASRLDAPPEVFVSQDIGGEKEGIPVGDFNNSLRDKISWGAIESVTVTGANGVPMQMWLVFPSEFDAKKKWPLAFLVHGGPQGAWTHSWSARWNPQVWAAQGYVVALPNPRGSTGFGQKYTDEISGDWGGKCYEDLMKGVEFLEAQPYIDRNRMLAAGASFGGYMMNWFQGKTTKFKTLVTHCGVYNFDSMYGTTEELWFDENEHGGPPWGNRHSYEEFSPHRLAKEFKTPMLIIHNDLDFRVPISEGVQLFTTLQRLGVPSKLINFPDEGHWVNKPANSKFWHEEIFAWIKKYCPPGGK
jgi:dipeptidyl aminopeptidase/acylaminoacyl peptidase